MEEFNLYAYLLFQSINTDNNVGRSSISKNLSMCNAFMHKLLCIVIPPTVLKVIWLLKPKVNGKAE